MGCEGFGGLRSLRVQGFRDLCRGLRVEKRFRVMGVRGFWSLGVKEGRGLGLGFRESRPLSKMARVP